MPPKKNYSIAESDLANLETQQEITEFKETYSIGGFDLDENRRDWEWDSDNCDYDDYRY
jgi:hypothetical protein